jgi:hypothetical protein
MSGRSLLIVLGIIAVSGSLLSWSHREIGWCLFSIVIAWAVEKMFEKKRKELLSAIRGRRREIQATQSKSPYKHIPGLPKGDPSSYVRAVTPDELEELREAQSQEVRELHIFMGRQQERIEELERERNQWTEQERGRKAQEFLTIEAERVQRERGTSLEREPTAVIIVKSPSQQTEHEVCKCGYPGCLGHEVIDNQAYCPGFTSEAALARSPHKIVCFRVEMSGIAGNPSDGQLPASAVQTIRIP